MKFNDVLSRPSTNVFNVVMHGMYMKDQSELFRVPDNIYIIFAGKPGYKLHGGFLFNDPTYDNIVRSNINFKEFLKGNIPGPRQFQNWRDHIYRPGSYVRNITFTSGEKLGYGIIGTRRITLQTNLQSIVKTVSKRNEKIIIFVASCRSVEGHVQSIPVMGIRQKENQNYNLKSSKRRQINKVFKSEIRLPTPSRSTSIKRKRSSHSSGSRTRIKRRRVNVQTVPVARGSHR